MKKHVFYSELAYLFGLIALALGTAMMEKAGFGVSMVVAPAYLVYLKINPLLPFFSFGMAEYIFQFILLILLICIVRRLKISYLFSFITAIIYGLMLDACMAAAALIPAETFVLRAVFYLLGMAVCAAGVSLLFCTYIAPEVYELFVKQVSMKMGIPTHRMKTIYDICSCLLAVIMSFLFFGCGTFKGVKLGTVFCALVNGSIIGLFSRLWKSCFDFRDGLPLRRYFE